MHIPVSFCMSAFWVYSLNLRCFLGSVMHGQNENVLRPLGALYWLKQQPCRTLTATKKLLISLPNAGWATHYLVMTSLSSLHQSSGYGTLKKCVNDNEKIFLQCLDANEGKGGTYCGYYTINKNYDDNITITSKERRAYHLILFTTTCDRHLARMHINHHSSWETKMRTLWVHNGHCSAFISQAWYPCDFGKKQSLGNL